MTDDQIDALALRYAGTLTTSDGLRAYSRALIAQFIADSQVLATYTADGTRRQWFSSGTWLYPGDSIVVISEKS